MNIENGTIVSGKLMEQMRKEGVDQGYVPVPKHLLPRAQRLLAGKDIASMDKRFRYLTKKAAVAKGNRRHEQKLAEARKRLLGAV